MQWKNLHWSEKATAVRRAKWSADTARQIAANLSKEYGPVTRNAVIGVCHRNSIELRGPGPTPKLKTKRPTKQRKPTDPRPKPSEPGEVYTFPAVPPAPKSKGVLFLDSTTNQCRFPMWADGTPIAQKTICGNPADGPWCAHHRAIVYQPESTINEQRRKARREHRA